MEVLLRCLPDTVKTETATLDEEEWSTYKRQ